MLDHTQTLLGQTLGPLTLVGADARFYDCDETGDGSSSWPAPKI